MRLVSAQGQSTGLYYRRVIGKLFQSFPTHPQRQIKVAFVSEGRHFYFRRPLLSSSYMTSPRAPSDHTATISTHSCIVTVRKTKPHLKHQWDAKTRDINIKCSSGFFPFFLFSLFSRKSLQASLFSYSSETMVHIGWSPFLPNPVSKNLPFPNSGHMLTNSQNQAHKQMSSLDSARK